MSRSRIENPECSTCKHCLECSLVEFEIGAKCSNYQIESYISTVLYGAEYGQGQSETTIEREE